MPKGNKKNRLSKELLLAEAKELFSRKGYKGTTIKDLTSIFGVSRPSIYYYFQSKMDILLELHAKGFEEATKDLNTLLASDMPTKEKFRKILELHTRNLLHDVKYQRILYLDEMEMPKELSRQIKKRRRLYTERIISLYEQGLKEGIFKNLEPKIGVYLLVGACNWLIMWYSDRYSSDSEKIIQTLMTILCEGYEK